MQTWRLLGWQLRTLGGLYITSLLKLPVVGDIISKDKSYHPFQTTQTGAIYNFNPTTQFKSLFTSNHAFYTHSTRLPARPFPTHPRRRVFVLLFIERLLGQTLIIVKFKVLIERPITNTRLHHYRSELRPVRRLRQLHVLSRPRQLRSVFPVCPHRERDPDRRPFVLRPVWAVGDQRATEGRHSHGYGRTANSAY